MKLLEQRIYPMNTRSYFVFKGIWFIRVLTPHLHGPFTFPSYKSYKKYFDTQDCNVKVKVIKY